MSNNLISAHKGGERVVEEIKFDKCPHCGKSIQIEISSKRVPPDFKHSVLQIKVKKPD
jgi:rRNA maturation protein Nop10